jgi:hypothetical protein
MLAPFAPTNYHSTMDLEKLTEFTGATAKASLYSEAVVMVQKDFQVDSF